MNIYLYYLFFAAGYGCVVVRNVYTISYILYKLKVFNFTILQKISSIMFIPLLIALFGEYLACLYFELTKIGCKNIKKIEEKYQSNFDHDKNLMKRVDMVRYLYKIVIFYFVIKYIKPEFNFINVALPILFIIIYFYKYPLDKSHFGKKMNFNSNLLLLFILGSVVFIFYLLSKLYPLIKDYHIAMIYLIYILLYFFF